MIQKIIQCNRHELEKKKFYEMLFGHLKASMKSLTDTKDLKRDRSSAEQ